jgi:hypothetical protein
MHWSSVRGAIRHFGSLSSQPLTCLSARETDQRWAPLKHPASLRCRSSVPGQPPGRVPHRALIDTPHQPKVPRVFVFGDHGAQLADKLALLRVPNAMRQTGDRGKNIDRWIARLISDMAAEHDVSIQRASNGIGNWFIVIVAVDQHGKNSSDGSGSFLPGARPLQQAWQISEYCWSVAAGDRRLSCGERDFAGGVGKPGYRIDHKKD